MFADNLRSTVLTRIPGKKASPGGWMSLNCPMCTAMGETRPDNRKRGGFNMTADNSIVFNCFNCGFKTGWKPGGILGSKFVELLKGLGIDDTTVNKLKIQSYNEREINPIFNTKVEEIKLDWQEKALPQDAKPIDENTPEYILEYLQSRGEGVYSSWNYYWTPNTYMNLNERIIIPCYFKKKVVGWITRHVYPNKTDRPKYYVQTQKNYMFNLDQLYTKERKYAILVEGPFDAIGIDGIGLLGSKINQVQADYLNTFNRKFILVPDRDKTGERLIDEALRYNWGVSFPQWDDEIKDVADAVKKYGRIFTLKSILESVENNPTKIGIKKRIA